VIIGVTNVQGWLFVYAVVVANVVIFATVLTEIEIRIARSLSPTERPGAGVIRDCSPSNNVRLMGWIMAYGPWISIYRRVAVAFLISCFAAAVVKLFECSVGHPCWEGPITVKS
jgi:hypothetical protein